MRMSSPLVSCCSRALDDKLDKVYFAAEPGPGSGCDVASCIRVLRADLRGLISRCGQELVIR